MRAMHVGMCSLVANLCMTCVSYVLAGVTIYHLHLAVFEGFLSTCAGICVLQSLMFACFLLMWQVAAI